MKNALRIDGRLLIYSMKRRRDATASIWIGPYSFETNIRGQSDALRAKFGASSGGSAATLVIPAPMPGLVNRVDVVPGAHVRAGDPLIVLEAMKMENVIRAGITGTVTKVNAAAGKSVEKGEVLVVIHAAPTTTENQMMGQ